MARRSQKRDGTGRGLAGQKPRADLRYDPATGVDVFVAEVSAAPPMSIVALEQHGVSRRFARDFSARIGISTDRLYEIMGVPAADLRAGSATARENARSCGRAAVTLIMLVITAQEIAHRSTAESARSFDAAKWLGRWIECPQPALGGRTPAELVSTPTGAKLVMRLLGAIESGAYQ